MLNPHEWKIREWNWIIVEEAPSRVRNSKVSKTSLKVKRRFLRGFPTCHKVVSKVSIWKHLLTFYGPQVQIVLLTSKFGSYRTQKKILTARGLPLEKPRKKFGIYTLQQSCEYSDGNFATFRRARHIKKVKTPLYIKVKSCPNFFRFLPLSLNPKNQCSPSFERKKSLKRRQIFFFCCLQFHTQVCDAIEIVV